MTESREASTSRLIVAAQRVSDLLALGWEHSDSGPCSPCEAEVELNRVLEQVK